MLRARETRRSAASASSQCTLEDAQSAIRGPEDELLFVDEALQSLQAIDKRKAQVVELRVFMGLSVEEAADVLGVSAETVKRDWRLAKAWLKRELEPAALPADGWSKYRNQSPRPRQSHAVDNPLETAVVHHAVEKRFDDDVLKGIARVVSGLQIVDGSLAVAEAEIRDGQHRRRHDAAVAFERLELTRRLVATTHARECMYVIRASRGCLVAERHRSLESRDGGAEVSSPAVDDAEPMPSTAPWLSIFSPSFSAASARS